MELIEKFYSVLIVSAAEKFNSTILRLLPDNRYYPVTLVKSVAEANRILLEQSFDIVLINAPLPDEFGTQLALKLCRSSSSGVLLFVRSEHYSDINARLMPYGIITLSKPTPAQYILETMLVLCGTRERLRRLEKKSVSFEEKMAEIRLINQAKLILIKERDMSETEAHRYIEKQAMDRCITKREVANEIVKG